MTVNKELVVPTRVVRNALRKMISEIVLNGIPDDIWITIAKGWDLNVSSDFNMAMELILQASIYKVIGGDIQTDQFTLLFRHRVTPGDHILPVIAP